MKKYLNEVKKLQKIAGILKESDMVSEASQLKTVHIDDKRMPGGRPSEIEKDYGLKVTPHEDGTFSVTGEVDKLEAYLEDYGIVLPQENVNEAPKSAEIETWNVGVKAGVELLKKIASSPDFEDQGFSPVEADLLDKDELIAWKIINYYPELFKKVMAEFGLSTEDGLHYDYTVFVKTTPQENVNEAPRAKKSSLSKVVMDTGAFDEEFMDYLRDANITFKILQWNGPGGGNPEVEYYGDQAALEAMIDGPFDSGDAEQNQDYKDQIEPA